MSLGSQVPEEQGVHGALKIDVQLTDLTLQQNHDPDDGEAQPLVEASHILLIARVGESSALASTMSKPPSQAPASRAW